MSVEMVLALMGFALVTSITPGPSNLILLATGANFGFRRTVPLVLGVSFSFLTMLLVVGFGLGQVLRANDAIHTALKVLSLLYILWLAWKIAGSRPAISADSATASRPLTFLQMVLLQWVNPKAWAVALSVTVAYTTPASYVPSLLLMTLVFGVVNLPSVAVWAVFGSALRRLLEEPARARAFNLVMAALLVAATVPIVWNLGALFPSS